jgi:hypothetical protein
MKRTSLIAIALVTVGLAASLALAKAKQPADVIVIDACKKKKAAVTFPHADHAKKRKIPCKTCHHNEGKPGRCSTSKCHAGKAEGKRPGCAEMSMKKNPFHIRCRGCHKKEKRGPAKCAQCHKVAATSPPSG